MHVFFSILFVNYINYSLRRMKIFQVLILSKHLDDNFFHLLVAREPEVHAVATTSAHSTQF